MPCIITSLKLINMQQLRLYLLSPKVPSNAPWHYQSIEVKLNAVSQAITIKVSLKNPSPENSVQIRKASEELDHQYKKEQEIMLKTKICQIC